MPNNKASTRLTLLVKNTKDSQYLKNIFGGTHYILVQQALEKHMVRKSKVILGLDTECVTKH